MSYRAMVLTVSDKASAGLREDTAGPAVAQLLREYGYQIIHTAIVPDEGKIIEKTLINGCDICKVDLLVTTGGTGLSLRDVTPEATLAVLDREVRGIPEAMRYASLQITPRACLSRGVAGTRGETLIVNLPGSRKAAVENLSAVLPALEHGLDVLTGTGGECGGVQRG